MPDGSDASVVEDVLAAGLPWLSGLGRNVLAHRTVKNNGCLEILAQRCENRCRFERRYFRRRSLRAEHNIEAGGGVRYGFASVWCSTGSRTRPQRDASETIFGDVRQISVQDIIPYAHSVITFLRLFGIKGRVFVALSFWRFITCSVGYRAPRCTGTVRSEVRREQSGMHKSVRC